MVWLGLVLALTLFLGAKLAPRTLHRISISGIWGSNVYRGNRHIAYLSNNDSDTTS